MWPSASSFCTRFSSSCSSLLRRHGRQFFQHLPHLVVGEKLPAFERLLNGPFEIFEALLIPLGELHVRIVEAALEEEIGQRLHQIVGIDAEIVAVIFGKS